MLVGTTIMTKCALAKHNKYRRESGEAYPKGRKALFPGILYRTNEEHIISTINCIMEWHFSGLTPKLQEKVGYDDPSVERLSSLANDKFEPL